MDVLVIQEDSSFRRLIAERLKRRGHEVLEAESPQVGLELAKTRRLHVALIDLLDGEDSSYQLTVTLKRFDRKCQIVLISEKGFVRPGLVAIKRDAFQILSKPCSLDELEVTLEKAYEHYLLIKENARLRQLLQLSTPPLEIIGETTGIQQVLRQINQAAPTEAPVLILGEKGTEKGIVADALHRMSQRRQQPIVFARCNTVHDSLLGTRLFSAEAGVLAGTPSTETGLLELADGGTVFVDELVKLELSLQKKLAQMIQAGCLRPIGSTRERSINTRLIAATHRNLDREVQEERLLNDLCCLFSWRIEIPPLRERRDDIPLLIDHFLRQRANHWNITDDARSRLSNYNWPGNVSELFNVLERAVMLAENTTIGLEELPSNIAVSSVHLDGVHPDHLAENERKHVERVLKREGYHRQRTAKALGINRRSLYRVIERHNIPIPEKGTDAD